MKRILYIDDDTNTPCVRQFADGMRALGEVVMDAMLSDETLERLSRGQDGHPFDAVVSHLPGASAHGAYSGYASVNKIITKIKTYGPAFELLEKMKQIADIPIVVYTGAGRENIPPLPWDKSGVDKIVHKSGDPGNDARQAIETIRNLWQDYATLPPATEPCFETEGTDVCMETTVRLNSGLGPVAGAMMVKLLSNFKWCMELIKCKDNTPRDHADDLLSIMSLEIPCGTRLKICMNETTAAAKDALCRVHRLLSARYLECNE